MPSPDGGAAYGSAGSNLAHLELRGIGCHGFEQGSKHRAAFGRPEGADRSAYHLLEAGMPAEHSYRAIIDCRNAGGGQQFVNPFRVCIEIVDCGHSLDLIFTLSFPALSASSAGESLTRK